MFTLSASAQEADSSKRIYHFNGDVSVTNNGLSFIPVFSLGKPATIASLSLGGERFSFDPQFRFDLNGFRPWSLIFIWRYKIIQTEKFQMKLGTHLPAYSFREQRFQLDGVTETRLVPYRMIALELLPTYTLTEHISVGAYYIHGFALEKFDAIKHINFLSLRAYFSNIHLSKQLYLNWNPEVYYLDMYGVDGFFTAHTITLGHHKIPVSLASTMNVKLKSEFEAVGFDWNISLVYSFGLEFTKK